MKSMPLLFLLLSATAHGQGSTGAQLTQTTTPLAATLASPNAASAAPNAPVFATPATASASSPSTTIDAYLDTTEKVFKLLAYLIGGAWVYFNYFKGRTYKQRLDCKVQAAGLLSPHENLAKVTLSIKNVGLTKVSISKSGSAIRVEAYAVATEEWQVVNAYDVIEEDSIWLEPGETLEETSLVHLTDQGLCPFRVQLVVSSDKSTWEASTIVQCEKGVGS